MDEAIVITMEKQCPDKVRQQRSVSFYEDNHNRDNSNVIDYNIDDGSAASSSLKNTPTEGNAMFHRKVVVAREDDDDDDDDAQLLSKLLLSLDLFHGVHDHFTLTVPSTIVRFGGRTTRIIANNNHQLQLEQSLHPETYQAQIVMQRVADSSHGLVQFLRLIYSLVAAFLIGFLFVCCLQILLFLVLNLSIELGITSKSHLRVEAAIGLVLSIPSFMKGLVNALSIACYYVQDVWRGHFLMKQWFHSLTLLLLMEWIMFLFYLGIPTFVMCIMLLLKSSQWWEVTSLVWFYCIFLSYVLFTITVICFETRACWKVTRRQLHDMIPRPSTNKLSFWNVLRQSILARQVSMYSGEHRTTYLALGSLETSRQRIDHSVIENTRREWKSLWSRLTLLPIFSKSKGLPLWEVLAEPEPLYNLLEARGVRPYVTQSSWSLEKSFCWPSNFRHVAILRGPGALTKAQHRSSLACAVLGNLLIMLLIVGFLIRSNVPGVVIAGIFVILAFFLFFSIKRAYQWYRATQDVLDTRIDERLAGDLKGPEANYERADQGDNLGVYRVLERRRLTRPTTRFCWFMFLVQFSLFFVWPLSTLIRVGSYYLGALFVVVVGISAFRYYINAAIVLEETGNMDWIEGRRGSSELWRKQARLSKIVGGITQSRSRRLGGIFVGFFGIFFLALCFASFSQKPIGAVSQVYTFLPDFYYDQQGGLAYPTCRLGKGIEGSPIIPLADYSFISNMAYRNPSITQPQLDSWFGKNVTMDNQSVVDDFRNRTIDFDSALSFKLITYPSLNISFVAIGGTTKLSHLLTDSQLWCAALFLQITRALLPAGRIWTPVITHLMGIMTKLESRSIYRVSYYRATTAFVKEWLANHSAGVGGIQLVGHSLGGGLAIITGAQTKVNAISFSGPNAKLSRQTFDPPLSLESLNTYTFNVIPARDPVAMIDDKAELFRRIQCRSSSNSLLACHDPTRTLCEILYACGTGDRPALCECVTLNDFPQPKARGSRTFEEACASSSQR